MVPGLPLVALGDSPVVQAGRILVVADIGAGQAFLVAVVLGIEVAASGQALVAYRVAVVAGQGTGDAFAGVVASVLVASAEVAQVMVAYPPTWVAFLLVDA